MKEIIFKISADGEISMEVKGAEGESCEEFTAPFEQSLGTVASKELKPEYYLELVTENTVEDSNG